MKEFEDYPRWFLIILLIFVIPIFLFKDFLEWLGGRSKKEDLP